MNVTNQKDSYKEQPSGYQRVESWGRGKIRKGIKRYKPRGIK